MPSAKKSTCKQGKKRRQAGKERSQSSSRQSKVATSTQDTIAETLGIMIPELTARLAALEHLLIEKQICSHEDLVRSREFVDIRQKLQ
jgi:hypothetical protein